MSALSSHLLEKYYTFHRSRAPFGQPLHSSQIASWGPMAYAPQMHGNFPSHPAFTHTHVEHDSSMILSGLNDDMSMADRSGPSLMDLSTATAQKIASLQAKLDRKLGPEYISQRPGPGGGPKLTYVEGWKIINLANEVFGFDGWSSSVVNLNTDFVDYSEETRRFSVGVSAVIKVTLRDGTYHEDVGYGILENSKSKGAALDKCKKEAVTDGIKRALRNFGNLLGNCLYDKSYAQEVIKIKVPPPKLDKSALHRRPEFDDSATSLNQTTASDIRASGSKPAVPPIIPKALGTGNGATMSCVNGVSKPFSALPPHIRPNIASTPIRNNPPGALKTGLNTPGQTPMAKAGSNSINARSLPTGNHALGSRPPQPNPPGQLNQSSNPSSKAGPITNGRQQAQCTKPPQAQQQRQPPPPISSKDLEREDTYSFNSEDDTLFAEQLDLIEARGGLYETEADMGRPIDSDEGVGGAIDIDEGGPDHSDEHASYASSSKTTSNVMSAPASNPRNTVGQMQQNQNQHGQVVNNRPPGAQDVQRPQQASSTREPQETAPQSDDLDEISKQILALRRHRNASRTGNQAPQANESSATTAAVSSKLTPPSAPAKPKVPSIGGFSFPSELSSGMQVGAKRSVDMMSSRNLVIGLAQPEAQGQANALPNSSFTRQPLATIEGGDLKRARR